MIPAIVSALPVTPSGGSAPSGATAESAGSSFGNAVKEVGRDHADKHGKGEEKSSDAKSTEADAGARTDRKRSRAANDEKDADPTSADGKAVMSAADILGRLLGGPVVREPLAADHGEQPEGGGESDEGELQERLVISTVMDLAGDEGAKETPKTQVSLRVLKMETHFEPRIDGATLVDPEKAATGLKETAEALLGAKEGKGVAEPGQAVRKGFEEILQGLGRPAGEVPPETGREGGDTPDRREENRAATAKASDKKASNDAPRVFIPAKSTESLREPTSTVTGQMISTQVAGRIVEAFSAERTDAAASSGPSGTQNGQVLRMTAGGAALKTLSIQLQPQDLGRLDVSMRLIDGRLSVELAASEPSTAQALAGDRHTLRKLLEHAGFALDDAAITIVARDVGPLAQGASAGNAQGDTQSGSSQRGQERAYGGGESRGGQGSPSGERRGEARPDEPAERRPARIAGNVFL